MLSGVFLISVSSALVWIGTMNTSHLQIKKESMSMEDAKAFPIIGSVVLLSIFFAFRYLSKTIINTMLRALFSATGTFSVYKLLKVVYQRFIPIEKVKELAKKKIKKDTPSEKKKTDSAEEKIEEDLEKNEKPKSTEASQSEEGSKVAEPSQGVVVENIRAFKKEMIETLQEVKENIKVYIEEFKNIHYLALFAISFLINVWYFKTKSMHSSNILACAFSVMAIQEIKPDSTKTVLVLLGLLFFYDIFWVFFTPVMIGVAKDLEIPIKIVYPFARKGASMIGLGDIVIPGIFLSLSREFAHKFSSPLIFTLGYAGYVLALTITFAIVFIFKAGQPALLYICPLIVAGSLAGAAVHKRTKQFIAYTTE
ncbi:minor histocompatibility antigen H13 [Nematocida ausubeli]|nr:minor histocompatibility antigen H13 [Nematocida ausubeli]